MTWKLLLCVAVFSVGAFARFDVTTDVTFRLFTQNNKFDWVNLGFSRQNLTNAGFDFNKDTKFVTHGFLNNGSGMSCIALRDAYLEYYDVNVIIVDYAPIGNSLLTPAPEKIRLAGEYIATFISFLLREGYNSQRLHLMGHSLGAHVIGHAARHATGGRIARVTALDPAMMADGPERLDSTVADFVDIIHTCSGVYGMTSSIGDADFYPNGGTAIQPSCNLLGGITCSHYEAVWFFVRSMHVARRYPAVLCNSHAAFTLRLCRNNPIGFMGIEAAPTLRGDYYINTEDERDNLRG